jgi:DNA-binding transcriptional LysR family regulator
MIPNPKLFVFLDAVARAGSIRGAAEAINVASTAINRKIIEVERDLGTPLFERLPRGVRLTAAGEILIGAIRRNLSDLASVSSQIEQLKGLVRGKVSIACSESVGDDLIPSAIARYQQRYPGVQFHIRVGNTSSLMSALLEYEADLILAHDPPPSEALDEILSISQPLCAMVKPDHPLAGKGKIRLADIQPYPIAIGDRTFFSRQAVDAAVRRSKLSLNIALEAGSVRPLKTFALDTGGVCFQFEIGTRREVRAGTMVALRLLDRDLARSRLVLGSRMGRNLPIAAVSFVELLRAELLSADED